MIDPGTLSRAFAGEGFDTDQIATLRVRSGAVLAGDPLTLPREAKAFTVAVPTGDHPVLAVDTCDAVILVFGSGPPERWEMAVRPGQDTANLSAGQVFAYPVDTGYGCFIDAEGFQLWLDELEPHDDIPDRFEEEVMGVDFSYLIGSHLPEGDELRGRNRAGYNLVLFPSGGGDGWYVTWVGIDADDQPVCLLTDFALPHGSSATTPTVHSEQ
jgi:hypothetical protein